jgi:hypothetical protein
MSLVLNFSTKSANRKDSRRLKKQYPCTTNSLPSPQLRIDWNISLHTNILVCADRGLESSGRQRTTRVPKIEPSELSQERDPVFLPKSANMISMQRLSGKLGGRDGTFVLQGKETAENGRRRV